MRSAALLCTLFAACASSTSELRREADPTLETRELDLQRQDQRRRDFQNVLIQLDQAMASYSKALAVDSPRAVDESNRIYKLLHEMVLDLGTQVVRKGAMPNAPGENYARLKAAADDASNPEVQGIALAALGFSGQSEVVPSLVQGAMLDDPVRSDRAVFGLAVLKSGSTPPGVLAAVAGNGKRSDASRAQAAWALYEVQCASEQVAPIVDHWRRFLTEDRASTPPAVLVQAVRGIGQTQDAQHADLVRPFLKHPVPLLRMTAAIAIGRMKAQGCAEDLIAMLGPEEAVPNVRLAANKALYELAGQVDYGYDAVKWRKVFDRKQ